MLQKPLVLLDCGQRMRQAAAINEYANSMFRFEFLSEAWIDQCARYLHHVFGDLSGKVVLDYAFGRGNWSLAFLKAGAARVIAVDASHDNVERFRAYCSKHSIRSVEVIEGDLLQQPLDTSADILWVYGVLHHVPDADTLVARIAALARDNKSPLLIYAYAAGDLRQFVVQSGRDAHTYGSEREFARDSFTLARAARLRARDDLTAPIVNWYTAESLAALLRRQGLNVFAQAPSPFAFEHGRESQEFRPHHFLCRRSPTAAIEPAGAARVFAFDMECLRELAKAVLGTVHDSGERKRFALGLFNTHFGSLRDDGSAAPVIVEDFLYLFHAMLQQQFPLGDVPQAARDAVELANRALGDEPRTAPEQLRKRSVLVDHLVRNRIRI